MSFTDKPRQYLDKQLEALKAERSTWETEWKDIQQFMLPHRGRWLRTDTNRGGRRYRKVYDGTATYALRTLSSGLMAGITSPARPWFKLTTPDPDLMKFGAVKIWLEEVEEALGAMFANSNVYNVLSDQYEELGGFGNGALLLYEDQKDIIRGYGMTVGEYWLANDDRNETNTLIREMQWTVGQCVQRFGKENVSRAALNLWNRGNLSAPLTVRHCIEQNDLYRPGMIGFKGKPWRSVWWEEGADKETLLGTGGFNSKPFLAPRWQTIGMDVYGRGVGSDVLGDTISLQAMTKKKARAVDKQIDPAMNLPGSMKQGGASYSLDPGTNNYVDGMGQGINATPAQAVTPNLSHFVQDIQEVQRRIEHGCYKDLFLMLHQMDRGQITATEIIERKAEKLIGLGPVVERLNDEMLEPLIDRAFDILMSDVDEDGNPNQVPPIPDELQGVKLGVQFISIFRQAQQQEDVTRTVGYVQNLALMAQAVGDPSVMDNLDTDEAAQILGNKGGVPATVVASVEKRDAKRQARAQAEQQMQAMGQAAAAVEAAKSLSETQMGPGNALSTMMGV
jgi:Bacteriophage head to tail connecting protein